MRVRVRPVGDFFTKGKKNKKNVIMVRPGVGPAVRSTFTALAAVFVIDGPIGHLPVLSRIVVI